MIVNGIVAEYNPFHNGHLYHLKKTSEISDDGYTVVVMSGDFTQRGEPAVWNKWIRAEIAVRSGADIVLELPFVFACNSAEYFSRGAVDILESIGCISNLSFGSECGDIGMLTGIAEFQAGKDSGYENMIREKMKKGSSYPRAAEEAVCEIMGSPYADILRTPNNILGTEYIKRLIECDSRIKPVTVQRKGGDYSDRNIHQKFPSAAAVRTAMRKGDDIGAAVPYEYDDIRDLLCVNYDDTLFRIISSKILTLDEAELGTFVSVDEGIECRMKSAVRKSGSLEELIDALSGKRYTKARIRRMLIHILAGLKKDDFAKDERCCYSRILAFSKKGSGLLKKIKNDMKNDCFRIITNINREVGRNDEIERLLKYDIRAADLYNLISGSEMYSNCEYVKTPTVNNLKKTR